MLASPGFCQVHSKANTRARTQRETWRDYGAEWRLIRSEMLASNPQCANCQQQATEVDHITPLQMGGTHDRSNLQSLCKPCHSRKTASETFARRNRRQ